jgi:hypothetical protein
MSTNQPQTPGNEVASLLTSSLLKTHTAPASSPATGTGVSTKPVDKADPMLAPPAAATTVTRPTTRPPRFVEHQIPIFGRARIVYANDRSYIEAGDAAKITGLRVADITELPDWVTITRFGLPAMRCWSAFRHFNIGGTVHACIDAEALLPICRTVRGGEYLTRFLLQCVLPPASAAQALGLGEEIPHGQFTTAEGQFVSQRFYNQKFGEIGTIVIGATQWLSARCIARIRGIPESVVIQLAGPGNSLKVPGRYLSTPINPNRSEVYVRSEDATGVFRSGTSWGGLAKEIEDWIDGELSSTKFRNAGAVVNLRGLHRVLDPAGDFVDWINELVGPARAPHLLAPYNESIPVTLAQIWVRKSRYRNGVVWLLLRDGGVCHGGRVGETADESLVRIRRVFPDENGQVSTRALHQFLRRKRTFESWLRAYSPQLHAKLAATKKSTRIPGDVLVSEDDALALLLWSLDDPADLRTTLSPSTKR